MRSRKRNLLVVSSLVFIGLWAATHFAGRQAVTRRIFSEEVDGGLHRFHLSQYSAEPYPYKQADYYPIDRLDDPIVRYPAYYTSTRAIFPFIIAGSYHVIPGPTQGWESGRIYLWFLGPIVEFDLHSFARP